MEELIANIREARARMMALLADPDLDWEQKLEGDTTVRRTAEHASACPRYTLPTPDPTRQARRRTRWKSCSSRSRKPTIASAR